MKQPLVSIITPTFNHERYIRHCIQSVQQQCNFNNWELIIVDDHSTDLTIKIINEFEKTDSRIKLITHKNNWGIANLQTTYNQALKMCKGEIVALLEGDDYWPKDKLEKQVAAFQKYKDAVLSFGKWEFVNNRGKHIYTRTYPFDRETLNNRPLYALFNLFLTLRFDIASSTVLINRKALEEIGGFQSDTYYPFPDLPTYLALAKEGPFVFVDEILGCYRRAQQSAWLAFTKESKNMGREEMRACINDFIKYNINKNFLTQDLIHRQNNYLFLRRCTAWISNIFNILLTK